MGLQISRTMARNTYTKSALLRLGHRAAANPPHSLHRTNAGVYMPAGRALTRPVF